MSSPEPVDYAHMPIMSMNMAGRFNGKEIRSFGHRVLRHLLLENQIGLFMGQQINFKPLMPEGFEYVGTNKAFLCYNRHLLKVNDERQYRHFLRDLHLRGHLPHSYLPEKNFVVMKMRYKNRPWTEFIAMSWMTEERQTKVKNVAHLRKVLYYASHLADAEEMPVVVGGTFRMSADEIQREMDYDFDCYGYTPGSGRRKMRMSNVFLCAKPMAVDAAKPLICSRTVFEIEKSVKWMNPEDAFYWDPIIGDLTMPIQTPDSLDDIQVDGQMSVSGGSVSLTRPITGISSKHLLVSASTSLSGRPLSLNLPTAPVLPTPQENMAPPSSPQEGEECLSFQEAVALSSSACNLPAIDEVSSEVERQDIYSDTDTIKSSQPNTPCSVTSEQSGRREEHMFEILETMMNDKNSTFYNQEDDLENRADVDPELMHILQTKKLASLEEMRNSSTPKIEIENAVDPEAKPEALKHVEVNGKPSTQKTNRMTASAPDLSSQLHSDHKTKELLRRAPSYREMYDEDLIDNNTTCYMSKKSRLPRMRKSRGRKKIYLPLPRTGLQ